jgi:2-polyprenyl-3-methyl-5-hydroxy-6-metoxy-1,4-benzoquinol methylase
LNKNVISYRRQQEEVNEYFQAQSSYWKDIYASSGPQAEIYRLRQAIVLAWIEGLDLAPGSRVLDVGCGAGFLSVELAKRGLRVDAIDPAEAMVELTRRYAEESGVTELLSVGIGDVCDMDFADDSFDLVVALGVIPWLERPALAIREMARVTRPGGHILLTADNRKRIIYLLDPKMNPILAPLRRNIKSILGRIGILHEPQDRIIENLYDIHYIDRTLAEAELIKAKGTTLGFGPFTFLGRRFLPKFVDIMLHFQLQHLADLRVPGFRSTGSQYLVLARKQHPEHLNNR